MDPVSWIVVGGVIVLAAVESGSGTGSGRVVRRSADSTGTVNVKCRTRMPRSTAPAVPAGTQVEGSSESRLLTEERGDPSLPRDQYARLPRCDVDRAAR